MAGPVNVPFGDQNIGQLPQTQVPQQDLTRERNMAKFSKSNEFAALKAAIESRIDYYQKYMPGSGNIEIAQLPADERGSLWLAADTIINEFRGILGAYEQAADAVKEADESAKRAGA